MAQNAVLPGYRHHIGHDGHSHQIQQRPQAILLPPLCLVQPLQQFKPHPATGQLFIRVAAIVALRVEDGGGRRQLRTGGMVVANDEVDTLLYGLADGIMGFDAAIEADNQVEALLCRPLYAGCRYPVALGIAVGHVIVQ